MYDTQQPYFVSCSNWMRGKFLLGREHGLALAKKLVIRMLMYDLFVLAKFLVTFTFRFSVD